MCENGSYSVTADEVIDVWKHHFGLRLILGKDYASQKSTNEAVRLIQRKDVIVGKILKLYREWNELRRASLRTDRNNTVNFKNKEQKFSDDLCMPMNICKADAEEIVKKKSGIANWKEDLQHLHNQLQRDQVGTVSPRVDKKQDARETRKLKKT